jgi:hypothetical protein
MEKTKVKSSNWQGELDLKEEELARAQAHIHNKEDIIRTLEEASDMTQRNMSELE